MKRACLWYFRLRGETRVTLWAGVGVHAFGVHAFDARHYGLDPQALVPMAYDSRVTR
jgi:hypothetical protein